MTNIEPDVPDKGRYSTREAAALLGVHRNTVLNWAQRLKMKSDHRKVNCRRTFTGAEIKRMWNRMW